MATICYHEILPRFRIASWRENHRQIQVMSRHDGVTCDVCMNVNFKGKRFKCLLCYDYDLCGACHEAGLATDHHTVDHPMQCILTRSDVELYFGGDATAEMQSYTCPHCGAMGFGLVALIEHVGVEHPNANTANVICPVCAASPINRPANVRQDLLGHLTLEHRYSSRDLSAFFDEPSHRNIPTVRRIPPPPTRTASGRGRRPQVHFGSSGIAALACSRDSPDPIAEFFSQLSTVGRPPGTPVPPLPPDRNRRTTDKTPKRTPGVAPFPSITFSMDSSSSSIPSPETSDLSRFLLPTLLKSTSTDKEKKRIRTIHEQRCSTARLVILASLVNPSNDASK